MGSNASRWLTALPVKRPRGTVDLLDVRRLPAGLADRPDIDAVAKRLEARDLQRMPPLTRLTHDGGIAWEDSASSRRVDVGELARAGLPVAVLVGIPLLVLLVTGTAIGTGELTAMVLLALAATVLSGRWRTRAALGRVADRFGQSPEVFADALVRVDLGALSAGRAPEARAVRELVSSIETIRSLPVWSSDQLVDHRLRLDLDREQREVLLRAEEIARLRRELGKAPRATDARSRTARDLHRTNAKALDDAAAGVRERVAALQSYRDHLVALQKEMDALTAVERLEAASEQIDELDLGRDADRAAAERAADLSLDADTVTEVIGELVDRIRVDLSRLRNRW